MTGADHGGQGRGGFKKKGGEESEEKGRNIVSRTRERKRIERSGQRLVTEGRGRAKVRILKERKEISIESERMKRKKRERIQSPHYPN